MLGSVRVKHHTLSTGRRVTPVHASGAACLLRMSLTDTQGASGDLDLVPLSVCSALWVRDRTLRSASGGVGPVTPCVCRPLCARDRCSPDASGANLSASGGSFLTVRDQRAWFKRLTHGFL